MRSALPVASSDEFGFVIHSKRVLVPGPDWSLAYAVGLTGVEHSPGNVGLASTISHGSSESGTPGTTNSQRTNLSSPVIGSSSSDSAGPIPTQVAVPGSMTVWPASRTK